MNLQHFVAGSCHFNGSAAFLSPTLVFHGICNFLQCDGARLSLVALQVVLAGGVGLGVGFVFLYLVKVSCTENGGKAPIKFRTRT